MLQTYEATLEPNGQVSFSGFSKPVVHNPQKILVTMMPSLREAAAYIGSKIMTGVAQTKACKPDWSVFSGALKNTAAFAGDPLSIQQQLRNEWR